MSKDYAHKRITVAVDNWPEKVTLFRDAFEAAEDWLSFNEGPGLIVEVHNFYVTVEPADVQRLASLCRRLNRKARSLRN